MLTKEQCQKKIFNVAVKLGVSPKLISTRLLSEVDKTDMLNGLIDEDSLETAVKAWMNAGMPDYVNPQQKAKEVVKMQNLGLGIGNLFYGARIEDLAHRN